jgi:hypothetical protein
MITGAWLLISMMLQMTDKNNRVLGSERKKSYCLTHVKVSLISAIMSTYSLNFEEQIKITLTAAVEW